jgi:hypothetical protein
MSMKKIGLVFLCIFASSVLADSSEDNIKSKEIIQNKLEFMAFCSLNEYEFTCLNSDVKNADVCVEYGVKGCNGREVYTKIAGAWIGIPYIDSSLEKPSSAVAAGAHNLLSIAQSNAAASQAAAASAAAASAAAASAAAASAAAASAAAASAAAASAAAASAAAASAAAAPPPPPAM